MLEADVRTHRRRPVLDVDVRARRGDFALDAAFRAEGGAAVALLGPNGAGKSTLLGILAGLTPPDAGRVALDGEVWDDVAAGVRLASQARRVGYVFQDRVLFPHLSALENVAFPLRARGVGARAARERAGAWLGRLGIGHRATARPATLSGGEAQRVALARALVGEPRLLLLDEPLAALDVGARGQIRALLGEILATFAGVAILVTHDEVDALTLARDVVVLDGGRVVHAGPVAAVREAPHLAPAAGLAGLNVYVGRLEPLEPGAARLVVPGGALEVAAPPGLAGAVGGVVGIVNPADVVLHLERPSGSARNAIAGRVVAILAEADRARVVVDGPPRVAADVTAGSVARLGLAVGAPVWVSFKAVEVELRLP